MKSFKLFLLLLATVTIFGCSHPTIRFDQTCINCIKSQRLSCEDEDCPLTFLNGKECFVTMIETGENIYMNEILTGENKEIQGGIPIAIAKISGKYYLTGNNFINLWIIVPEMIDRAAYHSLAVPDSLVKEPVFELYNNQLVLSGKSYKNKFVLDEDKREWRIFNPTEPKAGEQ